MEGRCMYLKKKILLIILGTALLISITLSVFAKDNSKSEIDYVALGDSLAAGTTPYNNKDRGYPDFLAESFEKSQQKVNFSNFAVSGYTSLQLKKDVLYNHRIREGIKEAEYITLDIGGNDMLYALYRNSSCGSVPNAINKVADNIQSVLREIDSMNPSAKIYVMGYYNVFPYSSKNKQDNLLPHLDGLNEKIKKVALQNGDTFVPTFDAISRDYQTFLPNRSNIHLSLEGYQAIAKEFWKHIELQEQKELTST
jgi:lysophospholipase L1-like esterase